MSDKAPESREWLLEALHAAISACHGGKLVSRALAGHEPGAPVAMVACGKAAHAMATGALEVLGDSVGRGLVIAPAGDESPLPGSVRRVTGEHPVPGAGSLAAGRALLAFLEEARAGESLLVLVSGGASSLVEVPREGLSAEALRRAWRWLLGSGLDIRQVNAVRQHLSAIKGGGLAGHVHGRRALVLALSDVPGNDPAVIGSGLLSPPLPAPDREALPGWLAAMLAPATAAPPPDQSCWNDIETRVIGNNETVLSAAAAYWRSRDLPVSRHAASLSGDVSDAAGMIAEELENGAPGAHLWGGECTVRLRGAPGRGGRCQHLALEVARRLAGRGGWMLLAAGTDGRDGQSDAAGALVDGGTLERGADGGMEAEAALAGFDSGTFLEAAGDLVDTGPTGTNVNDLVIGYTAK